jgi:hypothetical protein
MILRERDLDRQTWTEAQDERLRAEPEHRNKMRMPTLRELKVPQSLLTAVVADTRWGNHPKPQFITAEQPSLYKKTMCQLIVVGALAHLPITHQKLILMPHVIM